MGADSVDHLFDEYFDGMVVHVNDGHYSEVEDFFLTGDIDLHYSLDNEVRVCYNLLVMASMEDMLIRSH